MSSYSLQKWITALSILLFGAKIAAWAMTHSIAVLTDALESIVNVAAGFIGLYSLYVAAKPKDEEHPYGHGKAEFVSAAVEGTLIVVSGIAILYETIQTIVKPVNIHSLDKGLLIVAATAIINYLAGAVCLHYGRKNNSAALHASGVHLQTDTWSTIAIVAGLVLMMFTRLYWLDKVIALLMAAFIMRNGYKIIRQSLAGIMDEQDQLLLNKMVLLLNKNRHENWIDLHNFRIIKYGSHLHIDAHLTVPWYLNVNEAHQEIEQLGQLITNEFNNAVEFFVHTDGCQPFSCRLCYKQSCTVRVHSFEQQVPWTLQNLLRNKRHRIG